MKKFLMWLTALSISTIVMAQDASTTLFDGFDALPTEEDQLASIWKARKYLSISIGSQTLTNKSDAEAEPLKSKYAVSLQFGRTYRLHKKPIANMVMIGLDWSRLDINFAKYKIPKQTDAPTTSSASASPSINLSEATDKLGFDVTNLGYYQLDAGMALGPSVQVTPFYTLGKGLEYIKVYTHFHVIPSYSGILKSNDGKVEIASGYATFFSWGIGLTWKALSAGFETRWCGSAKYNTSKFNDDVEWNEDTQISDILYRDKTRYKTTTSRFVVSFRF